MLFRNRAEAGELLAEQLREHANTDAVVLALPRGGVSVGYEIARALRLPLDILPVRKIGHPNSPEYAIGAVDDRGTTIFNTAETANVDRKWLQVETERERREAERRAQVYRGERPAVDTAGKTVILVDDGIATGLTMKLAVDSVKAERPRRVIVAVPVAPAEAVATLKGAGAEVLTLVPPEDFLGAVGAHYLEFPQLSDEEVITLMKKRTVQR